MEESFRDSNHFAHRTMDELEEIREKGVDDKAVYDLERHLDEILEKMYELNKIIDSEKSNLEDLRQIGSCIYGPPI